MCEKLGQRLGQGHAHCQDQLQQTFGCPLEPVLRKRACGAMFRFLPQLCQDSGFDDERMTVILLSAMQVFDATWKCKIESPPLRNLLVHAVASLVLACKFESFASDRLIRKYISDALDQQMAELRITKEDICIAERAIFPRAVICFGTSRVGMRVQQILEDLGSVVTEPLELQSACLRWSVAVVANRPCQPQSIALGVCIHALLVTDALPWSAMRPSHVSARDWDRTLLTVRARDHTLEQLPHDVLHGMEASPQEVLHALQMASGSPIETCLSSAVLVVDILRSMFAPELPSLL